MAVLILEIFGQHSMDHFGQVLFSQINTVPISKLLGCPQMIENVLEYMVLFNLLLMAFYIKSYVLLVV